MAVETDIMSLGTIRVFISISASEKGSIVISGLILESAFAIGPEAGASMQIIEFKLVVKALVPRSCLLALLKGLLVRCSI